MLPLTPDSTDPHCLRLSNKEDCAFKSFIQVISLFTLHHKDAKILKSMARTEEGTNDEISTMSTIETYLQRAKDMTYGPIRERDDNDYSYQCSKMERVQRKLARLLEFSSLLSINGNKSFALASENNTLKH